MDIKFCVQGEPVGKGRPKFCGRADGRRRAYTPQKTADYENRIRFAYIKKSCGVRFGDDKELKVHISAYYRIADSVTKGKRERMRNGDIRPTKKPDIDNVVKIVLDGLNRIAYKDDTQVVSLVCEKYYSENPRVEVEISEI